MGCSLVEAQSVDVGVQRNVTCKTVAGDQVYHTRFAGFNLFVSQVN